jgi:hypothetical protein
MFDIFSRPEDAFVMAAAMGDLAWRVDPVVWWYLLASLIAAFAHRRMWLIYLGLAVFILLSGHG